MEDPTLRSNPLPEEQPATGDAGASEQAATPAEAENAPAQPSEEAAPEETPSTPMAQDEAAPEAPVTPPAEHMEPEEQAAAPDAVAQAETPDTAAQAETPAAPAAPEAPAAPAEPPRPRFSDLATGMIMEGTVTRIEKYGAFVNLGLADRREGLIHISEMAPHRIRRVEDVVKVGDSVRAKIVSIDTERRRIGLSLNEVSDDSAPQQAPAAPLEPAKTAMQMAFEEARSRRKELDAEKTQQGGAVGSRKKKEQEELMKRLRSSE